MKGLVLISGGTGLIGKALTSELVKKGYDVVILTRGESKPANKHISFAHWNIDKQDIDVQATGIPDYIIHLAGAGVMDKPWTSDYKKIILESRIKSSALLIKYLSNHNIDVRAFVSSSAIGWYGRDQNVSMMRYGFIESDPPDKGFLGETCRLWEKSLDDAEQAGLRVVKLRTGIVLSNNGGAFPEFKKSLKFGIASILGSGTQMISWIHINDLVQMYISAIENTQLKGPYNAVAPSPVSNKTLVLDTAVRLRGTYFVPVHVPEFMLKLLMGNRSIEILKSTTVSSQKIQDAGFKFVFPTISSALDELIATK